MKRNKFISFTTLGVLIAMCSCGLPFCEKVQFENDDLLWLTPYEKGDIIIFQSELGKFDSIFITDKDIYNPSNTFIFDLRGCNWMEGDNEFKASAGYEFDFINKTASQKTGIGLGGIFRINKTKKDKPISLYLSLCELYPNENAIYKDTTISLLNRAVFDCFILHKNECSIGESQPQLGIKSFVWSQQYGLVQYTIETGEKFEYFKKITSPVVKDMQ